MAELYADYSRELKKNFFQTHSGELLQLDIKITQGQYKKGKMQ